MHCNLRISINLLSIRKLDRNFLDLHVSWFIYTLRNLHQALLFILKKIFSMLCIYGISSGFSVTCPQTHASRAWVCDRDALKNS